MLSEFRDFIVRGNLVDLAVAVVIGAAFGALVTALVEDFITPLIAAVGGAGLLGARAFCTAQVAPAPALSAGGAS